MKTYPIIEPDVAAAGDWDAIVIGTGMGGSTIGHQLARSGHRVLFLEKGLANFDRARAEVLMGATDEQERLANGLWPTEVAGQVDDRPTRFHPPLGCGAGGSTLLYAAALERFDKRDLVQAGEPDAEHGTWPIEYSELAPYYAAAELMFRVRGSNDPLKEGSVADLTQPPGLSDQDQHFEDVLGGNGLHPYRLHVAIGYGPDCGECGGHICPVACKRDARNTCLEPALEQHGAQLLDRCEVSRLEADNEAVREVVAVCRGRELRLRARVVVLAAGAWFSPVLLLRSANRFWPKGLGNSSGLVGRNLMFHISDFIAVFQSRRRSSAGPAKTLAFRDYVSHAGERLGAVQSTGLSADYGNILQYLQTSFDKRVPRWLRLARHLLRVPAWIAARLFGKATVFATIMTDLPYPENRVVHDPERPSGLGFEYSIHPELRRRSSLFRRLVRRAFRPLRSITLGPEVSLNFGHPCGTCRFGDDPATSVLDRDNRAHGVRNLYVADASFMPTSGSANPSLTIAANALRVAGAVSATIESEKTAAGSRSA